MVKEQIKNPKRVMLQVFQHHILIWDVLVPNFTYYLRIEKLA